MPDQTAHSPRFRVLLLSGEYPPRAGGVGDYTSQLAQALSEQGHAVRVLTSTPDRPLAADGPAVQRLVRDWGFRCWPLVGRALDESRAEILHIQYQPGAFQLKGAVNLLPWWLRRVRPAVRVVTTFHDLRVPYLFPKAGPLRPLAVRALLRGSHGAIFADPLDLAQTGEPSPRRRWVPIGSNIPCAPPLGFDRTALRRSLGLSQDELLIGYFGFLSASKGADDLLTALRILLDRGQPARLVMIGAGASGSSATDRADEAAALALAERLGLAAWLRKTGFLAPAEVSAHLLACDLVALPYKDGASFRRGSLLAALEHGRPVVSTTPAPGAAGFGERALRPDETLLAVPPGQPAALAAAIARLADDPALAARLGRAARQLAERCTWPSIAQETAEVYAACFATGGPG